MYRYLTTIIFLIFFSGGLRAQVNEARNSGSALLLNFSYGLHLPGADLQERFGLNFSPGVEVSYITDQKNWILSLQSSFQFGSEVKNDVLAGLRTAEGFIIANDRAVADIQLRERGFYLGLGIGKLIGLSPKNYRSGIRLDLGVGLLQHQIRIQDDPVRTVAALTGDYRKGYDRLSNGPALRQFIGYQVLSLDKRANFFAGVELIQGFTRSRRDYDFASQQQDLSQRLDLLYGFRLGLTLPFYVGQSPDGIYY
ncbi:hypothetical protein [Flavilitoribacter nigricans]|uniref:Outer membrane protein beta-barrel domain-containing protein n=1 Tax=Flavilitoribacter nigricans (strain ATCC 23147 / DSM 23189 / NBRC 102662 / NCIMB 1420 / SS-2) TaxID=1122177 RepID=A0A2D0NGI8_FLAN2|nr:hypothetical protein [Flavilitoribacter nigricans]PHN07611.1 hypothetical protein CRP01_05785 [Flavilitoribacter nigricans DSM 23189 = NBRC 102662]